MKLDQTINQSEDNDLNDRDKLDKTMDKSRKGFAYQNDETKEEDTLNLTDNNVKCGNSVTLGRVNKDLHGILDP